MAHPYDTSEKFLPKDCTHILSEMYTVKELEEIQWIHNAAKVATTSMDVAIKAVHPSMTIITFTKRFFFGRNFQILASPTVSLEKPGVVTKEVKNFY